MKTPLNLKFATFGAGGPGVFNNLIGSLLTPAQNFGPKIGSYWWIPQLSMIDTDANGQEMALYLIPPMGQGVPYVSNVAHPIPNFNSPPGSILIGPTNSLSCTFDTFVCGPNSFHSTFLRWRKTIIVPSGWSLGMFEMNGVYSSIDRAVILQFLYQEIPNDCPAPEIE
jgi:hypothetical protein